MDQAIKKVAAAFKSKDEALRIINNNDIELSPDDLIIATKFVEEMVWPDEAEKKAADEAEKKRISNRRQKATRKKKEDDQQAQIKNFLKEVMASLTEAIEEESQKQQIDEREEVGSSSVDRRKYTREERGKGMVEEVSLPVVDEDAVEEIEVEKLTENDKPPVTEDELRITSLASGENNITKMEIPQNQSSTAHEPGNDLEPEPIEGREDKKPNHSESGSHNPHGSNVLGAGSTAPPQEQGAFGIPLLTKSQMRNLKKRGKTQKLRQEIEEAAEENRKHQEELKNLKEKKQQQQLENQKNQEKYQKTISDMLVPLQKHVSDCVVDCKVAITQMLVSTQLAISNMQEATATHQQSLTLALLQQFAASINNDTTTKVACMDAPDTPIT